MVQGNFLQSLFNRGQQQDVYSQPPLQMPTPQLQDIMINQQGQQMTPEQIQAFYSTPQPQQSIGANIANALLGQQSQQQAVPTQIDANGGMITSGTAQNPRTGGLLNDIVSGFRENANTPFAVSNLEPQNDKGFATKVGEGLGTVGRFAASPVGRGLLMAGLVGATGGGAINASNIGLRTGFENQQARTQDQFYRNQLQAEGADTSNIQGYITPEMYKNYSLGQYRSGMLDLGGKRLSLTDYNNVVKNLTKMHETNQIDDNEFKTRLALVNKKFENDNIAGLLEVDKVGKSNQTRNADINQYLAPAKKGYYEAMPRIASGRLALQGQQLTNQNERFQQQLEEGEKPVVSETSYNRDKFGNVISSTTTRKKGQPQANPTQKVMVADKNGKKYYLPQSQLQEAIKQGYKKI